MRSWTLHHLQRTLGEHASAWDALQQRLYIGHPMLDSRFVNGLLKHFGDGSECLCILTVDGLPQAMCLLKPRGLVIWQTFLPMQTQICPVLAKSVDDMQGLMSALPGLVVRLDLLCVDPMFVGLPDADTTTLQITDHALTMAISLDGDFENYRNSRSKKLIQNIGRYQRRLVADQHTPKFVQIGASQDISAAVARYAALESSGWKAELGTAINMGDKQGVFYIELMKRFAADGDARVFELWFDDHLVASRLAVISGRMMVMLKTTYDETRSQFSPGRLLLNEVIQSLFASHPGYDIEFYTNANADQLAWATGQRWIKHVSLYRNVPATQVFNSARQIVQLIKPGAKGAPPPTQKQFAVNVYRYPDEFPSEVMQFFSSAEACQLESGAYWYRNLVNAVFQGDDGVRFYVLLDQAKPVAALPILVKKGAMGNTVEALGNYYTTLYAPLLMAHDSTQHLVQLLDAIQAAHAPVASFRFAPMDPESASYSALFSALQTSGLAPFKFFCFGNWYQPVKEDWPTYLQNRDGAVRSTIKRMTKKFLAAGGTLEMVTGGAELEQALATFEQVYAKSWKRPEPYPTFIPGLIRTCAACGWLRLGLAWLDGKPIAAQFWIVANGKANIYKLAYDEAYKAHGPGTVLTAMLMAQVMDKDGVKEVDYLIGDDPYKKAWMSARRERWGIIAYNAKTVRGLWGLMQELFSKVVKVIIASLSTEKNRTP